MKDPFDISDGVWKAEIEVKKEFTDREELQEAFERKIKVLRKNWGANDKKESFYVLNYYGIGGIGKTSFQNKLCNMIDGDEKCPCRILDKIECDYIAHDFGVEYAAKDKLSILLSLRKQLKEKNKKFRFYCFDSAVLLYAKKAGIDISKDETVSALWEDNKWLDYFFMIIGYIPELGLISGIVQVLKIPVFELVKKFRKHRDKDAYKKYMDQDAYKKHLEDLAKMQQSEILERLHNFFIDDMRANMTKFAQKPVVVFLDTYEKYIETGNTDNVVSIEDHWLRKGENSVIRSIPHFLWVIMGRERLDWTEDDVWGEVEERPLEELSIAEKEAIAQHYMEQHLMGDLSKADSEKFLENAGVEDALLRGQLYELTSGTPLFLDLCVDTYVELCNQEKVPVIEDFGNNLTQLVNRYLYNLKTYNRELAYFLSAVGAWSDESVMRIRKRMHTLKEFTVSRYEEFVKHSFVITKEDGSYYMHETFRKAALTNADRELVQDVNSVMAGIAMQELGQANTLSTATQISEYITLLAENAYEYLELCNYMSVVKDAFATLKQIGDYNLMYVLAGKLAVSVSRQYHGTAAELVAFTEYANALLLGGKYPEAANVFEQIDYDVKNLEIRQVDMIRFKLVLIRVYHAIGESSWAQELAEAVYEEALKNLGENHDDTLDALMVMAEVNEGNGKAAQYWSAVGQKLIELKGVHIDTMQVMYKAAELLYRNKMRDEAEEALGSALALQWDTYGEDHPLTLKMLGLHADLMIDGGDVDGGIELLLKIREVQRKVLGEGHPDIWKTQERLSAAYAIKWKKTGEVEYLQKSEQLLKQMYWEQLEQLGIRHPDTAFTMGLLIVTYTEFGCPCDDERMWEEVLSYGDRLMQAQLDAGFVIEGEPIEYKNLKELFLGFAIKAIDVPGMLQAQLEAAKAYYEQCRQELGEKHPNTLKAMLGLVDEYVNSAEEASVENGARGVELLIQFLEIQKETNPERAKEFLSMQARARVSLDNRERMNELLLQCYRWLDSETDESGKIIPFPNQSE